MDTPFPPLTDWKSTKETLHAYTKVISAVPRALGKPHPKWWHISLEVVPSGLRTKPVELPNNVQSTLRLDLKLQKVILKMGTASTVWPLEAGLTVAELSSEIRKAFQENAEVDFVIPENLQNEDAREYDPVKGRVYLQAINQIDAILKQHRRTIPGEKGPVQLWAHGFDIAFEWFGTRMISYKEGDTLVEHPSQINCGWTPGEPSHLEAYFYSNPWPFEPEKLVDHSLPDGARWFTESWQGSIFPYAELVGDPQAAERVLAYAHQVFKLASPSLRI